MRVETEDGERLGHLFDIATALIETDRPPALKRLLVGRGGLARRLGIGRTKVEEVDLERIVRIEPGRIIVRDL